jgi:hypothetical protein
MSHRPLTNTSSLKIAAAYWAEITAISLNISACLKYYFTHKIFASNQNVWPLGYNEFDLFLENKEYRPFDGCKIEI